MRLAYSNPDFDTKLKKGSRSATPTSGKELMKDIEGIIQDSRVIIQPFWQSLFSHMNKKVQNYCNPPDISDGFAASLAGSLVNSQ